MPNLTVPVHKEARIVLVDTLRHAVARNEQVWRVPLHEPKQLVHLNSIHVRLQAIKYVSKKLRVNVTYLLEEFEIAPSEISLRVYIAQLMKLVR